MHSVRPSETLTLTGTETPKGWQTSTRYLTATETPKGMRSGFPMTTGLQNGWRCSTG